MSIWPKWGWRAYSPLCFYDFNIRSNIEERYVFTPQVLMAGERKQLDVLAVISGNTTKVICNLEDDRRNLRYSHHFYSFYKYNSDSPLHVRKSVKITKTVGSPLLISAHLKPASKANPTL